MAGRAPSNIPFSEILEQGAKVDDIFKDSPTPLGSNPFNPDEAGDGSSTTIAPIAIEEVRPLAEAAPAASLMESKSEEFRGYQTEGAADISVAAAEFSIVDNDSLFCVNRKFAALETLLKIVAREYYPFGQMISDVLRVGMDQVKSEAGSFIEIDYQNQCMFFRAVTGRSSQNLLNFTIPLGQGIAGFVCENQQPLTLSSIDDSSRYLRSISDSVGFETRNLAAYPIVIRGVTFGCIELLNRLGEPQFTDADKEVLATICQYAGKVIENRLILAAMSRELEGYKKKKTTEDAA